MTATTAPNYGRGEYTLPGDTHDLDSEQQRLTSWLESFLAKPTIDLPRPPAVALEIMTSSRKPNTRIEDLAALLEREPLLAGRVLRLSNSALYASSSPCVTLKQALIRMGLNMVRDVVMEAAMQLTVIHAEGFNASLEAIRRHSSAVAWISRFVARNTPLEAENAFMLGLLHDVGLSVSLIGTSEYLKHQRQPMRLTPESWVAAETMHERFSDAVLKSWGLPPQVTLVAKHHHSLIMDGHPHPQVAVLIVAEQIAENAGWGINPQLETTEDSIAACGGLERPTSHQTERALQALSLTERHFATISEDMKRVLETLEGQFKQTERHAEPHARQAQPAR